MRAARRIAVFFAALVSVLAITEGTTQVEQSQINKAKMYERYGGSGMTRHDPALEELPPGRMAGF